MTPADTSRQPSRVPGAGEQPREHGRGERIAMLIVIPLAVLLFALVMVFYVLFDVTIVAGPSMLPTLQSAEYTLNTKTYDVPVRGDIVVFHEPGPGGVPIDIIKRVVGVPGDTVAVKNGVATVNGNPEPAHPGVYAGSGTYGPIVVPSGTVFVLGDNRPESLDSRVRGPIPLSQVNGRAVAVIMPVTRVRLLER
jgi:signal peptidase I